MRRKVVLVLAVPVVLAAVFGGLRVSSEFSSALSYSTTKERVNVLGPATVYLAATERLTLPATLADRMGNGGGTPAQAYATAEADLKRAAGSSHLTDADTRTVAQILQIGNELSSGGGIGASATPSVALSNMARLTTQLVNSTADTQGTPDPRVQALAQTVNGRLSLTKQQLLLATTGVNSQLGLAWFTAEVGVEGSALDNLKANVGNTGRVSTLGSANSTRLGSAAGGDLTQLTATPSQFNTYDALSKRLLVKIDDLLAQRASAAQSRALTDAGIILAALLASLLLALFVARALINPLRKVRAGALDVANVHLPETVKRIRSGEEIPAFVPIDVHTREELGQLARAVDDMHRQAVNLATGEAQLRSQVGAMFVTLSRRNTTLVNQQLALIESLEQDEEDPQRLEQLFSLDHLATRMRRTADSLVILGGTAGRSAGFEELSVSDVVHAAVSEVQDYQRVRIDGAPDRRILGRAAGDIVHLMAELIDNALSYSPPGSPVTIQASEEDGRVEIEVVDSGLGMAGDALAQANESLTNGGEVTVDTARRMGLFVVSRLAEQHGLTVKLRRNLNGGGIIASVLLPTDVLVSDQPVQHTSLMDAPAVVEEPAPVAVAEEPAEDYDPYLERIEEAIAAVTGLPRRRPGFNREEPVETAPAAPVSMFDPEPEPVLMAGYEPAELEPAPEHEREPIALGPVSLDRAPWDRSADEADDADNADDAEDGPLAEVVTADFGGDRATAEESTEESTEEPAEEPAEETAEETAEAWTEQPVAEEPVAWADRPATEVAPELPEQPVEAEAGHAVATAEPVAAELAPETPEETTEPDGEALAPVAQATGYDQHDAALAPGHDAEAPIRLTIRRPLSATPAASALDGDYVADSAQSDDSPIFGQLRSNWLGDESGEESWEDGETDAAWTAASRIDAPEPGVRTPTGLPVRRPGNRLVPGGVTPEPVVAVRDPEAIRNRLAAHAAGVSRGRAAAAAQPVTDPYQADYAHEETGPA